MSSGPGRVTTRPCVHDREVVCDAHGPGARKYFRPVPTTGQEGAGSSRVKRKSCFECEATRGGRGRLTQTRLSSFLMKTTPKK